MNKFYDEQKIHISQLDLDLENPRFLMIYNNSNSEEDLIRYLLKNENAIDVVKSIVEQADFRSDSFLYVVENNGRYLVREGNRRLAAVKALQNPEKYLGNKYEKFIVQKLPCLVYSNKNALEKAIASRHTQTDVRRWSRLAQGAYIYNCIKDGMQLSDLKYLKDYISLYKLFNLWQAANNIGYGEKFKKLVLDWDRATLVERFFSEYSQKVILPHLGFKIDKKDYKIIITNEELFKLGLDNFMSWLNPQNAEKITTQMVNNNTIDKYFNENFFTNKKHSKQLNIEDNNELDYNKNNISINDKESDTYENTETLNTHNRTTVRDTNDKKIEQVSPRSKKHSKDRTTYLPTGFSLSIQQGRARDIFAELRRISPIKNKMPNAFAVLTRIFLEMTLDFYGEKNIKEYKNKNINSKNYELYIKMRDVIEDLKNKNIISTQEYNTLLKFTNNDKTDFINIHTLHQYVHNSTIFPNDNNLKTTWDNLSKLFIIIWNSKEVN